MEVGIDIEQEREDVNPLEFGTDVLSAGEEETILNSPCPIKSFFKLWTRKEAYLKGIGMGLNKHMSIVPSFEKGVSIFDIDMAPGYAGTLIALGGVRMVKVNWYRCPHSFYNEVPYYTRVINDFDISAPDGPFIV
jgi:hypothetical protein